MCQSGEDSNTDVLWYVTTFDRVHGYMLPWLVSGSMVGAPPVSEGTLVAIFT